jgi:hypothetical protein
MSADRKKSVKLHIDEAFDVIVINSCFGVPMHCSMEAMSCHNYPQTPLFVQKATHTETKQRKQLPAAIAVLGLLVLVLELGSKNRACYGAHNAVAAHLIATEVASSTTSQSAHQAAVTLCLSIGVRRSVGGSSRLAVWSSLVLTLRVLVG